MNSRALEVATSRARPVPGVSYFPLRTARRRKNRSRPPPPAVAAAAAAGAVMRRWWGWT
ncbi:hypothetical protein IHE61_21590 [Streptomyces sp. GKU 257-1]|nr:hypothetical protein [Streptomyces sp. GKU 257-1]